MVQIKAPEFDPDIDGDSPPSNDKKPNEVTIQGTLPTIIHYPSLCTFLCTVSYYHITIPCAYEWVSKECKCSGN